MTYDFLGCSACLTDGCRRIALQLSMILAVMFLKVGLDIYTVELVPLVVYLDKLKIHTVT